MRRVGTKADVRHQVLRMQDRQGALRPASEGPLVVPRVDAVLVYGLQDARPVVDGGGVYDAFESLGGTKRGPQPHPLVIVSPRAPPARPAPDVRESREVVARWRATLRLKVVPGDPHDALVVAIAIQHLVAKSEEARVR